MRKTELRLVFGNIHGDYSTVHYINDYYEIIISKIKEEVTLFEAIPLNNKIPNIVLTADKIGGSFKELKIEQINNKPIINIDEAKEALEILTGAIETIKEINKILKI